MDILDWSLMPSDIESAARNGKRIAAKARISTIVRNRYL
jgi:hypothetical protein